MGFEPEKQKRIHIPERTPIRQPARTLPPKKTPAAPKQPERPLVPV